MGASHITHAGEKEVGVTYVSTPGLGGWRLVALSMLELGGDGAMGQVTMLSPGLGGMGMPDIRKKQL